jgi:type II secretory pathway component GspD/PulD (secretin)
LLDVEPVGPGDALNCRTETHRRSQAMNRFSGGLVLVLFAIAGASLAQFAIAQDPDPQPNATPRSRFRGDAPSDEAPPAARRGFSRRADAAEPTKIPQAGKLVSFDITILEASSAGKQKPAIDLSNADKIAEQLRALEEKGAASVISRVRLSSLEQMPCSVQIGESKPTVTGRTGMQFPRPDGARGPNQVSYQYHNVGMMVKVTSRVESDEAVLAEIELSSSRLAPANKPADESAIPPERTTTMSTQSTVRIPKGQVVVVSASQSAGEDDSRETLVLISAKIESSPAAAASADAQPAEEKAADAASEKVLKVFKLQHASAEDTMKIVRTIADFPIDAVADIRTNSVLIRANPAKSAELEALIERLDRAE